MSTHSLFRIRDLGFEVKAAELAANLRHGAFFWSLSITGASRAGRILNEVWEPRAYSENLFPLRGRKLEEWFDITKEPIQWKECFDHEQDATRANMYIFGHEDIYESTISWGRRLGNVQVVNWSGLCDVNFDEKYGAGLRFDISAEVPFVGIKTDLHEEREAWSALREYLFKGEFRFVKSSDPDYKPSLFAPA